MMISVLILLSLAIANLVFYAASGFWPNLFASGFIFGILAAIAMNRIARRE